MVRLDWFKLKKKQKKHYLRTSIPFFSPNIALFFRKRVFSTSRNLVCHKSYIIYKVRSSWSSFGLRNNKVSKYLLKFTKQCCSFYSSYTFFFFFFFAVLNLIHLKKYVIKGITFLYQELDICSKLFFWQLVTFTFQSWGFYMQMFLVKISAGQSKVVLIMEGSGAEFFNSF